MTIIQRAMRFQFSRKSWKLPEFFRANNPRLWMLAAFMMGYMALTYLLPSLSLWMTNPPNFRSFLQTLFKITSNCVLIHLACHLAFLFVSFRFFCSGFKWQALGVVLLGLLFAERMPALGEFFTYFPMALLVFIFFRFSSPPVSLQEKSYFQLMSRPRRFSLIVLATLIPLAVMWRSIYDMVTMFTLSRFIRRGAILLEPLHFGMWTVLVGIILYSWYRWFTIPTKRTFLDMLLATICLGIVLIMGFYLTFYFRMPGDGPIPD